MCSLMVSLKCMYRGMHKLRTSKWGRGVYSKVYIYRFSYVIALLKHVQRVRTCGRAGVTNLTYLSVRSL